MHVAKIAVHHHLKPDTNPLVVVTLIQYHLDGRDYIAVPSPAIHLNEFKQGTTCKPLDDWKIYEAHTLFVKNNGLIDYDKSKLTEMGFTNNIELELNISVDGAFRFKGGLLNSLYPLSGCRATVSTTNLKDKENAK